MSLKSSSSQKPGCVLFSFMLNDKFADVKPTFFCNLYELFCRNITPERRLVVYKILPNFWHESTFGQSILIQIFKDGVGNVRCWSLFYDKRKGLFMLWNFNLSSFRVIHFKYELNPVKIVASTFFGCSVFPNLVRGWVQFSFFPLFQITSSLLSLCTRQNTLCTGFYQF